MKALTLPQNRNFRCMLLAQGATSLGDGVAVVALAFAVLQRGSPSDLALVLLGRQAAMVVGAIPGGAVADRMSRRLLIVLSLLVRSGSQAGCAILVILDAGGVAPLVVLQTAYGIAAAVQWSAFAGFLPELVARAELLNANAWLSLAHNGVAVVGPAIGGVLVVAVGAGYGLAVDAASFLVAGILVMTIRTRGRERRAHISLLSEIFDGWHELRRLRWAWSLIGMFALFSFVTVPCWYVLGPTLALTDLGGAGAWGAILAFAGVGSVIGSLCAMQTRGKRPLVLVCVFLLLSTVQFVGLAALAPLWCICIGSLAGAAARCVATTLWHATFQQRAPSHAISRLSSYNWIAFSVPASLGYAVVTPVANRIGITTTLYAAGALAAGISLLPLFASSVRAPVDAVEHLRPQIGVDH